jgi:hypothetical protein
MILRGGNIHMNGRASKDGKIIIMLNRRRESTI